MILWHLVFWGKCYFAKIPKHYKQKSWLHAFCVKPRFISECEVRYNMTLTNNRLLIISHLKVFHSSILTTIFITVNL